MSCLNCPEAGRRISESLARYSEALQQARQDSGERSLVSEDHANGSENVTELLRVLGGLIDSVNDAYHLVLKAFKLRAVHDDSSSRVSEVVPSDVDTMGAAADGSGGLRGGRGSLSPSGHLSTVDNQHIRYLMKKRWVTQSRVAQKLGLSQSTVSNRLSGKSCWSLGELRRLGRYFDVPVQDLFQGSDSR